jgi:hypothetical protein
MSFFLPYAFAAVAMENADITDAVACKTRFTSFLDISLMLISFLQLSVDICIGRGLTALLNDNVTYERVAKIATEKITLASILKRQTSRRSKLADTGHR